MSTITCCPSATTPALHDLLPVITPSTEVRELFLVVQVKHGLSNRLRALASARSFATKLGRRFAVVWEPDFHCNVRFADLFEPMAGNVPLYNDTASLAQLERRNDVLVIDDGSDANSTRGSRVQREGNMRRHLYLWTSNIVTYARQLRLLPGKSARPWHDLVQHEEAYKAELRALRPVDAVLQTSRRFAAPHWSHGVTVGSTLGPASTNVQLLGVHVRMLSNLTLDVPGIDEHEHDVANNRASMLDMPSHRLRCGWSGFVEPANEELERSLALSLVYVAADVPEAARLLCTELLRRRGPYRPDLRCASASDELWRRCEGSARRAVECTRAALAELWLLSHAWAFVGSEASSYSSLVLMLNPTAGHPKGKPRYRSGCKSAPA